LSCLKGQHTILQLFMNFKDLQKKMDLTSQGQWRVELLKLVRKGSVFWELTVSILNALLGSVFMAGSLCYCFAPAGTLHWFYISRFSCNSFLLEQGLNGLSLLFKKSKESVSVSLRLFTLWGINMIFYCIFNIIITFT
jgi:hypothetical protein